MSNASETPRQRLANDLSELGSYAAVGRKYDVHRAVIWRILNDKYVPHDNATRRKLGMGEIVQQEVQRDEMGRFAKAD